MKKTLITLLALGGLAMGADVTTWNLGGENIPAAGATSYELTLGDYTLTLSAGGALTNGTWVNASQTLNINGSADFWTAVGESALSAGSADLQAAGTTWIGGSTKSDSLVITLSGLEAGEVYDLALLTGLPFEVGGAWNSLTTTNEYASSTLEIGKENIAVNNTVTGFYVKDIVADTEGKITMTVNAKGKHTAVLNGLSITQVPEPATATLSLLALAGLAARRRRK